MIDLKQKIVPFLWYPRDADIAVQRYLAVFGEGRVLHTQHWGEGGPVPAGSLMAVTVELAGQTMVAFNGGPHEAFNDAASMFVTCDSQAEIDRLWEGLTADGGKPIQCGWLHDPWGLRWQIVPRGLLRMMADPDPARATRVTQAMLASVKFDMAALQRAYEGG